MKIVLVNHKDTGDMSAFSGTSYFMNRAIRETFEEVVAYDLFEPDTLLRDVHKDGLEHVMGPMTDGLVSFLKKNICEPGFVICQGGTACAPLYNHTTPLVIWHDSTWHTFLGAYLNETRFEQFRRELSELYRWDKGALDRAALVVFSSHYIAEACIRDYGTDRNKVRVIPFGANIANPPFVSLPQEVIDQRKANRVIELTFYGLEWKRKGLMDAFLLTTSLNSMGIAAKLNVIGGHPTTDEFLNSPFVQVHGFLHKSDKNEQALLDAILKRTHFLVHPAISEPFGIALCEANAYGVPILGTDVGGLKTIVMEGKNGYLFQRDEMVVKASGLIRHIFGDFEHRYVPLVHASFAEYTQRLNWKSAADQLKRYLAELS